MMNLYFSKLTLNTFLIVLAKLDNFWPIFFQALICYKMLLYALIKFEKISSEGFFLI